MKGVTAMYDGTNVIYAGNPYAVRGRKGRNRERGKLLLMIFSVLVSLGICAFSIITVLRASGMPKSSQEQVMPEILAPPETGGVSANELVMQEADIQPKIPVVMLDAGHGGMDEGCMGGTIPEKEINLEITLLVKLRLEAMGYEVMMTREDDTLVTKEQRVELANTNKPDIFVSIHQNTYEDATISGIETWYDGSDTNRDSKRLAQLIHRETLKSTKAQERELCDTAELLVTGQTTMPACLIETGFLSNQAEQNLLADPAYQEQIAAGIASGIALYLEPKTMYLTFDDGPSADNTSAVLDILQARNIKATFFVVGENVRKNPEVARRIVAQGHTIGIHCNRHEYDEVYQSAESYLQDFEEAYKAVKEATGVDARLFRFPGGSINSYNEAVRDDIMKEMRDRGFIYYDWNCSLEDAVRKAEPGELITCARETALDRKKVVLLAHDIIYGTVLCLDDLIEEFPEYKMEALTPEIEPVQF